MKWDDNLRRNRPANRGETWGGEREERQRREAFTPKFHSKSYPMVMGVRLRAPSLACDSALPILRFQLPAAIIRGRNYVK